MKKKYCAIILFLFIAFTSFAQHPLKHWTDAVEIRYDSRQPVINYILSIDSNDSSFIRIEMRIRNIADSFHVAMVAHPEYDDRYWRFIEDFYVETKTGRGRVLREDSALWKIITTGNEAILHYRVHLPPSLNPQRSAWRPFLSATGGLVGGPHSFMYIVGFTLAPSHVKLNIPDGWKIVTGLESTSDPTTFFAPSAGVLVDCPILIGKLKTWSFTVDGVPHRVVYWPLPNAISFDTSTFVFSIQKLVQQTSVLFERLPYREYSFMLQDGAYGSLEHTNSVTVGAPSMRLSEGLTDYLSEIAHEYFHTWNLMRIRPVEYGDVDYKTPPLSRGLWFSEGLTMFYADLLSRRAGIPVFDSTRIQHLERLIRRYFGSPGNVKISPEKVSLAQYGPLGMLGDYTASTHLQGELLGTMLDFIIRDASNGKHSMDDVMRKMMERFCGEKGFTGNNVEEIVTEVCGYNLHQFFNDHVRGNKAIDFDKWLRFIGLRTNIEWENVLGPDGKPVPDLQVYPYQLPNEAFARVGLMNPTSCWGKAGLHTGDLIKKVNGAVIMNAVQLRQIIRRIQIGDTVSIEVQRPAGIWKTNVIIAGYQQPVVHISEITVTTEKQRRLYGQWISGK